MTRHWAGIVGFVVLASTLFPARAATLIVSPDQDALQAREMAILASEVRHAVDRTSETINVAGDEDGVHAIVSDVTAAQRFLADVEKRYSGKQYKLERLPARGFRIVYSPAALERHRRGLDHETLEDIVKGLRTPLPDVAIEPADDGAIVKAKDAAFGDELRWLLRGGGFVVTQLSETSWHVAFNKDYFGGGSQNSELLRPASLQDHLRRWLIEPLALPFQLTEDGAAFTVIEPEHYGPFLDKVRQRFAHNPDFALTETEGAWLHIAPNGPNYPDFRLHEIEDLANPPAEISASKAVLTVRAHDAAYNAEKAEVVRRAVVGRTDVALNEQPDHSLVITRTAAGITVTPEFLKKSVERRLASLKIKNATVLPRGEGQVAVTFSSDIDAGAFRRSPIDASLFAVRLVDERENGPLRESQRLPAKDGHPLWLRPEPIVTSDMIADAKLENENYTGMIVVQIRFTEPGRVAFAAATKANVYRRIAIVVDGVIVTAPVVREPILGGAVQITGNFTPESAQALADAILSHRDDLPLHVEAAQTDGFVVPAP